MLNIVLLGLLFGDGGTFLSKHKARQRAQVGRLLCLTPLVCIEVTQTAAGALCDALGAHLKASWLGRRAEAQLSRSGGACGTVRWSLASEL